MILKVLLGLVLGLAASVGMIATIVAFWAVVAIIRKPKTSVIYIMAGSNLFIDILHLALTVFYLAPCIIFDSFLFPGGRNDPVVKLLGSVFMFCWYNGSVAQMLVAINRFVVVCMPRNDFFTRNMVIFLVGMLYPIAILVSYISQYANPCCAFIFDHAYLSYSYAAINDTMNYSNYYIDLPLNSTSSAVCALCYATIVIYVHRMNATNPSTAVSKQRRQAEYIYALQFSCISMFYLFSWVFFRIFPQTIPAVEGAEHYFIIIALCVVLNSSANAIVYLLGNKEVRGVLSVGVNRAKINYISSQKSHSEVTDKVTQTMTSIVKATALEGDTRR